MDLSGPHGVSVRNSGVDPVAGARYSAAVFVGDSAALADTTGGGLPHGALLDPGEALPALYLISGSRVFARTQVAADTSLVTVLRARQVSPHFGPSLQ